MPKAHGGLYFHTEYQDSGWPAKGYEAQVNQSHPDRKKTGGLYAIADVLDESPVADGQWHDYDIIVDGRHIVLKINGKVTTDPSPTTGSRRPGCRAGSSPAARLPSRPTIPTAWSTTRICGSVGCPDAGLCPALHSWEPAHRRDDRSVP